MKKLLLIFLLGIIQQGVSQTFDVDTIVMNGDINKRINLVILGDGYQTSQLNQFVTDATSFKNALFATTPYNEYQDYFNVFAIKVPSTDSGTDHPGTATDVTEPVFAVSNVNTYFSTTFDGWAIHRLLVIGDQSAVTNVLANNFPSYDQVAMLVNSPNYGGSGGQYAVSSLHTTANEIAIHEIGHSFVGLADEYWAGNQYAAEKINMTQQTNAAQVKWSNWMNTNSVGIYQHCCGGTSANWYRPHQNCKMRYLGSPFCSVCVEGTIENIHSLVDPIDSYSPVNSSTISLVDSMKFSINVIHPTNNSLRRLWILNGDTIDKGIDSTTITLTDLNSGNNTLVFNVEDTSSYLRVDNHSSTHYDNVVWTLNKTASGIETINAERLTFSIYPNPVESLLNIELVEVPKGKMSIQIINIKGEQVFQSGYINSKTSQLNLKELSTGTYFARIYLDDQFIGSKKLIKQ